MSLYKCSVPTCVKKRIDKDVSFHKVPKDPKTKLAWMKFCRVKDASVEFVVCSQHFEKSCYKLDLPGNEKPSRRALSNGGKDK